MVKMRTDNRRGMVLEYHQSTGRREFKITFNYPLAAGVVGTPQMTSQPVFSLHFSLFSTTLWDLANSRPVHSLTLSSYLFFCLPCLLSPFTVPCNMVLARSDDRQTCPYNCSLPLFTVRGSSIWHRLPRW